MRTLIFVLILTAAGLSGTAVFLQGRRSADTAVQPQAHLESPRPGLTPAVALDDAQPVPVVQAEVEDPGTQTPELSVSAWELQAAQAEIARLRRELELARNPGVTPWSHVLEMPESEGLSTVEKQHLQGWLEDYPVLLQPGEVVWLTERLRQEDWELFARDPAHVWRDQVVVDFLGAQRVLAELSPEQEQSLRDYWDEEYDDLFN